MKKHSGLSGTIGVTSVLQGAETVDGNWLDLPSERIHRHPVASGRAGAAGWIYQSMLTGGSVNNRISFFPSRG